MVMAIDRVSETVALTTRPAYQQTRVYSHLDISGHRRHKEEIKFKPVLTPVKYADTAYVYINNTRKRFVSRTYYEPRVRAHSFADTTYANPTTTQETFVTCLDAHADQQKSWFKTTVEIKPKNFTSTASYPNPNVITAMSSSSYVPSRKDVTPNGNSLSNGYSHSVNGFDALQDSGVDENMNRRIPPVFKEKYDPGASQVFIPERREQVADVNVLAGISDQILVNYSDHNTLCNGHGTLLNGVTSDVSDF